MSIDLDHRPLPKPSLFANNRARALKRIVSSGAKGAVLIFGLPEPGRPMCDFEPHFRQESCFYWLTGVNEPECAVYIDLETSHTTLFYPELDPELAIWSGPLATLPEVKEKYGMDEVIFYPLNSNSIGEFVNTKNPSQLYTLKDTLRSNLVDNVKIPFDYKIAFEAIGEERQFKSEEELTLIRYACDVNCDAFQYVFKGSHPGIWAQQFEGILQHKYIDGYCRLNAFATIVCSGIHCATLHYHQNDRKIQDGEMVLVDAGCEYYCYSSDNTRTFPVNGKFSPDQRAVYQAVLDTQKAVIAAAKPGVLWPDMAKLSAKVMAEGLLKAGLFQNGTADEIVQSGAMAVFYPHGLGHGMGLDCHEIAGWEPGHDRPDENHVRCLRMGRVLQPGIVVTVEPGCYFVPLLYEPALKDPVIGKYINKEACERFRKNVGGVRIEDDILITPEGNVNLSHIPKEIDELEAIISAAQHK